MREQIPLNTKSPVISLRVAGDLEVQGVDSQAIEMKKSGDEMSFRQESDRFTLTSRSDCSIVVPRGAILEIEKVGGDTRLRSVIGKVMLLSAGGDLAIDDTGPVEIQRVGGDCSIKAAQGDITVLKVSGDLECRDIQGGLSVTAVGGDFAVTAVTGSVRIRSVSGSVHLMDTGPVEIDKISGDLNVNNIRGELRLHQGAGDLHCLDVRGPISIDTVGGDFSASHISQGLRGSFGGDTHLDLVSPVTEDLSVNAGGDIVLQVPSDIDAIFRLGSSGERIEIQVGERQQTVRAMTYQFQAGDGKRQIQLNAGGDITVSSTAGFAPSTSVPEIPYMDLESLGGQIQKTVDESLASAGITTGKAEHRTRQMLQKAERRIQEAMRRVKFVSGDMQVEAPVPPVAPEPPVPFEETQPKAETPDEEPIHQEPVSDEERLLILRMVQEKKITIEQAEQLLEALDVQDFEAGL